MNKPSHSFIMILARAMLWCLILAIILFTASYVYVRVAGKPLLENILSVILERPTTFQRVRMALPYDIVIEALKIPQVLEVKRVIIRMASFSVSDQQLIINRVRLKEPVLTVHLGQEGGFRWGDGTAIKISPSENTAPAQPAPIPTQNPYSLKNKELLIRTLEVEKGRISVAEKTAAGEKGVDFQDLMLKITNVSYPLRSLIARFEFTSEVISELLPFSGSGVHGQGWFDLVRKDMDAQFRMTRLNESLVLTADVTSRKNEMTVEGELDMRQIGSLFPGGAEALTLPEAVGQALAMDLMAQYSFQTRMDHFRIEKMKVQGVVESPDPQKSSAGGGDVPSSEQEKEPEGAP